MKRKRRPGFSLIEVVASVIILAVMAGGVVSLQSAQGENARRAIFERDVMDIQEAVGCYLFFHGDEPDALENLTVDALLRRGFLRGENKSPWGTAYKLAVSDGAVTVEFTQPPEN